MRRLPFLIKNQEITSEVFNDIIRAINNSIIEQPEFEKMRDELQKQNTANSKLIHDFIASYGKTIQDTPDVIALLKTLSRAGTITWQDSEILEQMPIYPGLETGTGVEVN